MSRFSRSLFPLLLIAAPALAAGGEGGGTGPVQRTATVFGADPCPKAEKDEIVVCSRLPENERYRLPKQFRGKRQEPEAVTGSWANTARALDQASAPMRPNSCSPQGSFGQSGCLAQFLAQARAERRMDKAQIAAEREAAQSSGNDDE
jgi:hypothetical protein